MTVDQTIEIFRKFSRVHGIAVRRHENMRRTAGPDERDNALGQVQEIENEFAACFQLIKEPQFTAAA
jgi:hypothetical protein